MRRGVVTLSYYWLVQETEIFQREQSDLILEIEFYMNKTSTLVKTRQLSYSNEETF